MSEDKAAYQQFNFQIAIDKIESLTEQNNELLDTVDRLEMQLKDRNAEMNHVLREPENSRFEKISEKADAAMRRFTTKLRKELSNNGKSKQGQGKSV